MMNFLGVKLDNLTLEQARLKIRDFLVMPGQYKIFTPNPEIIVKAQKDENFKKVLNDGDLNICDGFGLWLAIHLLSHHTPTVIQSEAKNLHLRGADPSASPQDDKSALTTERIPGIDFMLEICKIAEETDKSIFLLGTNDEKIVAKTAENLQKQFSKLKIAGYDTGPVINNCHPERSEGSLKVINKINQAKSDIIFIAFGMGKQEKWISENLAKMPSVKIAMGVGGAFDYISGTIPRAPLFLRKIGLEWMCRLVRQPKRIWRIFNATFKFLFLVLNEKI